MKAKNVQSIICLVIFFLFANQAWAANWIYFDTAAVGEVYYGKNSIKKLDKSITLVWNKVILSKEAKTKYFTILKGIRKAPKNPSMLSYYKKLMQIDCANRKIKDISVIFYDEKGKVIYSSSKGETGEWNDILPDTVGEKLINIVSCEPVSSKEAVAAPKVEEPVAPKEAVAAPKVEEPVAPKEAVAAPKVEEPVAPKEAVAPKVDEPVTLKEAAAPKADEPVTPKKAVVSPRPLFAAFSGHVASFKSEDNAIIFVNKMKAKRLVAFYQKEDVPGKGEFYRAYIGRYKTSLFAHKALTKLKKAGEIDFFKIKKMSGEKWETVTNEMENGAQKNEPAQKTKNKTERSIDTRNYYKGIKGIVLKNGKVVKGQIISVYNDVLKIRTKHGKILSYSFMKVKKYITE